VFHVGIHFHKECPLSVVGGSGQVSSDLKLTGFNPLFDLWDGALHDVVGSWFASRCYSI